jgi:hypothetical protein
VLSTLKILTIIVLALIETVWFVYMLLWGKTVQKQIENGEITADKVKQPFLGLFFILYHFPVIILLTMLNKNDETKGLKIFILTFITYTLVFFAATYFV